MGEEFPYLKKALQPNQRLKKTVFGNYPAKYLQVLEKLFNELLTSSCKGLDAKVSETSPDLTRFQALISELEFAKYLLGKNMNVELLSNNAFGGRKPPDIYAKSDAKDYFVEVKNIQLDEMDYIFGNKIAEILNAQGLAFCVAVKSSSFISTPAYFYNTRDKKENFIQSALDEFSNKLKTSSLKCSPVTIRTKYAEIELHQTNKKRSYLGIGSMKTAISEPSDYGKRIRNDILLKSKKRETWIGDELYKRYIVAIDDDSVFFYIDRYNVEIFGNATYYKYPLKVPDVKLDPKIEDAIKTGWEGYLERMCILQNNRSVIPEDKRGLFFTDPLTKNVSAVLVKHRNDYFLLANPLADHKVNDPAILRDFKDCYIGWE